VRIEEPPRFKLKNLIALLLFSAFIAYWIFDLSDGSIKTRRYTADIHATPISFWMNAGAAAVWTSLIGFVWAHLFRSWWRGDLLDRSIRPEPKAPPRQRANGGAGVVNRTDAPFGPT
jgi:hypothetical protein